MARASISKEQWAAAKTVWENDPSVTFAELAENLGTSRQTVQLQAKRNGWQRRLDMAAVAARAHAEADSKFTQLPVDASSGAADVYAESPETGMRARIERVTPQVPANASPEEAGQAVEKAAVDRRTEVLNQHRKEWIGARSQIYNALKTQDIDLAKRAKILAEALKVLQDGERRSWGLDNEQKPGGSGVSITINRKPGVKSAR
jgi:hypothetical protein